MFDAGIALATPRGVTRLPERRNVSNIRQMLDICIACSQAVYTGEKAVFFHGVWIHRSCYRERLRFPGEDRPVAAPHDSNRVRAIAAAMWARGRSSRRSAA
jgi:hypothetical protein